VIPLPEINAATREGFVARLGAVFEHSPWAAEQAYDRWPFAAFRAVGEQGGHDP